MKKCDIAIDALLLGALIAIFFNLPEEGYLAFVDLRPIAETQLAKVLDGNTEDCLTTPSQTTPVPMSQALKLEGKTTRQVLKEFPNYFCEGKKGTVSYIKFLTDSSKQLYVQIDKTLDEPIKYGFTKPEAVSPATTTKARRTSEAGSVLLPRESQKEGSSLERR
jgi:hypothetical protein